MTNYRGQGIVSLAATKRRQLNCILCSVFCLLTACSQSDNQPPPIDIAPQRAQLKKAKDLEQKVLQDAENQRKAIE